MKTSTEIDSIALHVGEEKAVELVAKAGFDVTVYEQKSEGTLGYDWTDIFAPNALGIAGMDMPDKDKFEYKEDMTFFNPSFTRISRLRLLIRV